MMTKPKKDIVFIALITAFAPSVCLLLSSYRKEEEAFSSGLPYSRQALDAARAVLLLLLLQVPCVSFWIVLLTTFGWLLFH
jgi:hypothetical protein